MIEMLIVVALVGIVATLALPSYKHSVLKAREAVLREDLWVMRDLIDQFHTDKGRYPSSLDELVTAGYLRRVPVDPFTGSATWREDTEPLSEEDLEESEEGETGITDVHSLATGTGSDGIPYSEW
jgi:general secretion pathway protein G